MLEINLIQTLAIAALPILFAITLHEVAHGFVAYKLGDQTARLAGRLTINPLAHIDLVGTILVPIVLLLTIHYMFGWAKPVPIDARNLRNPRLGMALVAIAGPISNLLMALFWAGIAKIGFLLLPNEQWFSLPLIYMGKAGILINVVLAVLNMLPILPLDGGRVVSSLLSGKAAWIFYRFEPYGFLIMILLMVTGILFQFLQPPVMFIMYEIEHLFGLTP